MEEFRTPKTIAITDELRFQLNLLSQMEADFVSDLVLALVETANGIKQDPEEMPFQLRITDVADKIHINLIHFAFPENLCNFLGINTNKLKI